MHCEAKRSLAWLWKCRRAQTDARDRTGTFYYDSQDKNPSRQVTWIYLDYFNLSQEPSNECCSDLVFMLRATPHVLQNPLVGNHFEISEPLWRRDCLWASKSKMNEKVIVDHPHLIFVCGPGAGLETWNTSSLGFVLLALITTKSTQNLILPVCLDLSEWLSHI